MVSAVPARPTTGPLRNPTTGGMCLKCDLSPTLGHSDSRDHRLLLWTMVPVDQWTNCRVNTFKCTSCGVTSMQQLQLVFGYHALVR